MRSLPSGTVTFAFTDVEGSTELHRAARICSAGHGGQVLVSQSTRALLREAEARDLEETRPLEDLLVEHLAQHDVDAELLARLPDRRLLGRLAALDAATREEEVGTPVANALD